MLKSKRNAGRNVSLARALSKLGFTSRSIAAQLVRQRKVSVNGRIVIDPTFRCALDSDTIQVDGKKLRTTQLVYIAMNKPKGVVTTRSDERGRRTVYDILGDVGRWVFPVGRLDKNTSGLLILTNDNRLGESLTNPKSKIPKTYRVMLDKQIAPGDVQLMERGMVLDGERLLPAKVKQKPAGVVEITIVEGKNRQIRRMCDSLGYEILDLVRTNIGHLSLEGLKLGSCRYLSENEIRLFLGSRKTQTKMPH